MKHSSSGRQSTGAVNMSVPPESIALMHLAKIARSQLIAAVDELMLQFVNEDSLREICTDVKPTSRAMFDSEHERFCYIAEALMTWHSDDYFLSTDGIPRPLTKFGKRSLTTLTRKVAKSRALAQRLHSDLLQSGVLEMSGELYLPAQRSAVLARANLRNLAYVATGATRLMRTMSHNVSGKPRPLFERQVTAAAIRATDVPVFLHFIEDQAQYLIDSVDDWLACRKADQKAPGELVRVGIGAFAWAGPSVSCEQGRKRPRHPNRAQRNAHRTNQNAQRTPRKRAESSSWTGGRVVSRNDAVRARSRSET